MNGDISRFRLEYERNAVAGTTEPRPPQYSSVRYQQGRGELDADRNEETEIRLHDTRTARLHVIGQTGAVIDPQTGRPGMQLTVVGGRLQLGQGAYYVDGIRCETNLTSVPDSFLGEDRTPGRYVALLDVWERPVTAIQVPELREVALGGPDTTIRTKVDFRVRVARPKAGATTCDALGTPFGPLLAAPGRLRVAEAAPGTVTGPCDVPERAGYVGLENQLYRIQIHGTTADGLIHYKWSRDNSAVVASWEVGSRAGTVKVDRLGPGGAAGFERGLVELSDDSDVNLEREGRLFTITDVEDRTTLVLDLAGATLVAPDPGLHPQARHWDNTDTFDPAEVTEKELDAGLRVTFEPGLYNPGDYWVVAARTAVLPGTSNRRIDWPLEDTGGPAAITRHGPIHHYAPLAMVDWDGSSWSEVEHQDCRKIFATLTDQIAFGPRGGDGQEAPPRHWLPQPLRVGVSRGRFPVTNARVRFAIDSGEATLLDHAPLTGAETGAPDIEITTNFEGIAECYVRLGDRGAGSDPDSLYVPESVAVIVALLVQHDGSTRHLPPPVRFVAFPRAEGGAGEIGPIGLDDVLPPSAEPDPSTPDLWVGAAGGLVIGGASYPDGALADRTITSADQILPADWSGEVGGLAARDLTLGAFDVELGVTSARGFGGLVLFIRVVGNLTLAGRCRVFASSAREGGRLAETLLYQGVAAAEGGGGAGVMGTGGVGSDGIYVRDRGTATRPNLFRTTVPSVACTLGPVPGLGTGTRQIQAFLRNAGSLGGAMATVPFIQSGGLPGAGRAEPPLHSDWTLAGARAGGTVILAVSGDIHVQTGASLSVSGEDGQEPGRFTTGRLRANGPVGDRGEDQRGGYGTGGGGGGALFVYCGGTIIGSPGDAFLARGGKGGDGRTSEQVVRDFGAFDEGAFGGGGGGGLVVLCARNADSSMASAAEGSGGTYSRVSLTEPRSPTDPPVFSSSPPAPANNGQPGARVILKAIPRLLA